MKKWLEDFRKFYRDRRYVLILSLTALCAYGFMVTHSTVGIDDTPYEYYFEEGLAVIVGRWVLFLLNRVVHISDFAPFLTDFAGVLILMAAVTVWAALFRRIFEESVRGAGARGKGFSETASQGDGRSKAPVPWYGYLFFAAVFLSCPLISEVYTYFLHNGIAIGYLACGVSLCCFREGLVRMEAKQGRRWLPDRSAVRAFLGAAVGMWIAMGCYESFMIVWLQGVCLLMVTERFAGVRRRIFPALCIAGAVAVLGMILRSTAISLVTAVFGLGYLKEDAVQRSITEMAAWLLEPGAMSELAMVLKRMFVMYGVFAYAYLPVAVFLLSAVFMGFYGLWRAVRGRDAWCVLLTLGGLAVPLLLAVIECKATYYRSAQFLPLVCGYGVLLAVYAVENLLAALERSDWRPKARRCGAKKDAEASLTQAKDGGARRGGISFPSLVAAVRLVTVLAFCIVLWNQCTDMNRWFYVDYLKYESAKELAEQIALELEQDFDTSKPVVFTGSYEAPKGIIGDAYVPYGSETYYKIKRITDLVDGHLLEKFYRPYGVWVAQTPALSVIDWARYAFENDEEMARFFAMHGKEIVPMLETDVYEEAELFSVDLPKFPREGSIVDTGEYIIVHL